MNINELEKRMREAFGYEKAAVDTDDLWNSISEKLPPQNRNRWKKLLLIFLPFFFVGGFATWYGISDSTVNNVIASSEDVQSESQIIALENEKTEEENARMIIGSTNVSGSTEATHNYESEVELVVSEVVKNIDYRNENGGRVERENIDSKNQYNSDKSTHSFSYGLSSVNDNNVITNSGEETTVRGGEFYQFIGETSTPFSFSHDNIGGIGTGAITTQNASQILAEEYAELGHLDIRLIDALDVEYPRLNLDKNADPKPFWIATERRFFVEIGGSFLTGHGNLTLLNADWTDHLNAREQAEESLASFSLDLKWGMDVNEFFSVWSGVVYSQYMRRSSGMISTVEEVTIQDGVVQEIIGQNGTQQVMGSVQGTRMTTSNVRRINQYSFVHIPIGVQYRRPVGALELRFSLEGRLGMNANYSGYLHPNQSSEYSISEDSEEWYNSQTPHFLSAGVGMTYPFLSIMSITFDAHYLHQLGSIHSTTYGIQDDHSGIGIRTGIRIKL